MTWYRALFGFALIAIFSGARCANTCIDLDETVCEHLSSAECQAWRADPAISDGMIPGPDWNAGQANTLCGMWLQESALESYTLPLIRWRIAAARDPRTAGPPPATRRLEPAPDAIPFWAIYAIAPIAFVAMFLYYRRAQSQAQRQTKVETWDPRS